MSGFPEPPPGEVELRPAFEFTCEECGHNAYLPCVSQILSPEETRAYLIKIGDLKPDQPLPEHFALTRSFPPERVECPACGAEFRAEIAK